MLEDRTVLAAFTAGNIAIMQMGTSSDTTGSIIELHPSLANQTTPIQTIGINGTGASAIRFDGAADNTGYLSVTDNTYIVFAGANAASASSTNRGVGALDTLGSFSLQATYTGASGNEPQAVTSVDNSSWFFSEPGGIYKEGGTSPLVSGVFRGSVKNFGGIIYAGVQSVSAADVQVVTVSSGGAVSDLPGLASNSAFQDFYLINSGSTGNYDVLYILSHASATQGSISKYSLVGGTWVSNGTLPNTPYGGYGLAAQRIVGGGATLWVTTGDGTTGANRLLRLTDSGAYNQALSLSAATTLYTAPAGQTIKGVVPSVPLLPKVVSITRDNSALNNLSTVSYTVKFNQHVSGVNAADFLVTATGVTGFSVGSVTSNNPNSTLVSDSWTVTVNTGSGDGTIRLDVVDDDTIRNDNNIPLGGTNPIPPGLPNGNFTTGEVYTIDKTPPTVVSSVIAGTSPTNASIAAYTVTFSEAVNNVDTTDFDLTVLGSGSIINAMVTNVTMVSATTYSVLVDTGTGDGDLRLNVLDDDSIVDNAGNTLAGAFNTGQFYTIDKTPPKILSITRAGLNPSNASTVDFTVTFDESVTGVTTSHFNPDPFGLSGAISVQSMSGSGSTYTVTVRTGLGDGDLGLDFQGDNLIKDLAGNKMVPVLYEDSERYDIDRTAPVVQSIVRDIGAPNPTNAASVNYTVTFSEDVAFVDVTDFGLVQTGTLVGSMITGITPVSGSVYTVSVNTGTGKGNLHLEVTDDDSISDQAANLLGGPGLNTGDFSSGEVYAVDKVVPVVSSITRASTNPTNAASVDFTVTFSENVTGVDISDFALTTTNLTGHSIDSVTEISPNVYKVTVLTGTFVGQATLRLDVVDDDSIIDTAGNKLGGTGTGNGDFTTGQVYTISELSVLEVVCLDPNPTLANTVRYRVTFGAAVTGVDKADFQLVTTGVVGAAIATVTGSGANYTVTVNTGTGNGTIRLDVIDNDTIISGPNRLGGAGPNNGDFNAGEVYIVDKAPPVVVSIVRASLDPTPGASVTYTVNFSEPVTGVDASDFTLTTTGLTGTRIGTVTGSGAVYTVTVVTGTGNGTIRLNVVDNDSITDAAGHKLGGTGTVVNKPGSGNFMTGEVFTIDRTVPRVLSINRAGPSPAFSGDVNFLVTFSEAVTGVDVDDFIVASFGMVNGAAVTNVTGGGNTYTVTVNTGIGDGTVRLDLADNDSIADLANNKLGGVGMANGDFTTGQAYSIVGFGVQSVSRLDPNPTNAQVVNFLVTFGSAVTGVDFDDFSLKSTGLTGAMIIDVLGAGDTYLVTVDVGMGTGNLCLIVEDNDSIANGAGTLLGGPGVGNGRFTTGEAYQVERTPPTVLSVVRTNFSPTSSAVVNYTVTFSENVTGVDVGDFVLGSTGVTGASIVDVTGGAKVYNVSVNTGTDNGTVTLNMLNDGSIFDLAGNALTGALPAGSTYTIVKDGPTITDPTVQQGMQGKAFTATMTVNGPANAKYTLVAPIQLPPGLKVTIKASTITIYGTPTTPGNFTNCGVTIKNQAGLLINKAFTIDIAAKLAFIVQKSPNQVIFDTTGGVGIRTITYTLSAPLPAGITITPSPANNMVIIQGTPTTPLPRITITLTVTDLAGNQVKLAYTIGSVIVAKPKPGTLLTPDRLGW